MYYMIFTNTCAHVLLSGVALKAEGGSPVSSQVRGTLRSLFRGFSCGRTWRYKWHCTYPRRKQRYNDTSVGDVWHSWQQLQQIGGLLV